MSLRKRIMLLVAIGLVVATVPLGVMGLAMVRAATDRVLEERLVMTRATAWHLNERLVHGRWQLDRLSTQVAPLWRGGNLTAVHAVFADIAPQLDLFSGGVLLVDRTGHPVIQEPDAPDLRFGSLATLPSLQQTLATGRPATSKLIRTGAGVPVVIVTVPILDVGDTVIGAVGGMIDLTKFTLQSFIEGTAQGTSGHAVIVTEDGTVLASTNIRELFTRNEHPEFFTRLIVGRRALVGPTEVGREPRGHEETHVMAFAPLAVTPWGVGIGQTEEETFGPIRLLRDRIILFELVVLCAALVFAWLDTSAVAAPLHTLKEAAENIASGNLARQIEVRRTDEIGTLARSFETMRVQLLHSLDEVRRRARASQSLYEIGTDVLSLQGRNTVLYSIAGRATSLLQTDVAVVCLLDESGKTARISAAAGAAAALVDTKVSPAVLEEPGLGCLRCINLDSRYRTAHLVAPLTVGPRTVGALCVATRTDRVFTAEDQEVLGGLANLAAIAVENARLQEQVQSVAMLEERERIAREMHDSVGQVLGYVNTKAQAVKVLLDSGRISEAQAQLAQLEQAAQEVYADLREAILGLRTAVSPDRRLMRVLLEYVRRFSELSGVTTELIPEGDPSRYAFSPTTELHLIRIIQEALTNVRKHAMARRAWVRFAERERVLTIAVTDDGVGFDATRLRSGAWSKFGLQTMRERAEAIGGTFSIRARDGSGTEVMVCVPVPQGRIADASPLGR